MIAIPKTFRGVAVLALVLFLAARAACGAGEPDMKDSMARLEKELSAKYGEAVRPRLTRGLRQAAEFWRAPDGDAVAFEEFVRSLWRTRPLAICSGALREEIEAMLEGISLRDCFPVIVAAEDVTVGKPDPSGYLLTLKLLSEKIKKPLAPADCLVVEDAPTVIRSVKAVGFPTLGVATSYPLMKLGDADWAVKTLRPEEVKQQVPRLKLDV